jgi:hypothetical protein
VVVTDGLRQTLVDTLAKAGGTKGNQALLKELGWDDATYCAVKDDLVATGHLVRGKGRGGSVSAPAGRGGGGGRGRGPMVVMTLTSPAFADGARPEPARRTTPDSLSANPRCCARRRSRTLWT